MRKSYNTPPLRAVLRRFVWLVAAAGALGGAAGELAAQGAGRIVGRVLDPEGTGIAGAQVEVVGTPIRTLSGIDGRYTLLGVPSGPRSVRVEMLGYQSKTVTDVQVAARGLVGQDITLSPEAIQLQGLEVSARAERGTVARALEEQRNASSIVSAITAEQIRRSPDSDAGQAVQRVSGVTVQDGKYVFVRGLGERYTTTSLNNARLPSPEPERKVVPLDLFPTGLLEGITTSKTFTPEQPGDFSGAQVDLRTREFPLGRVVSLSASIGFNDAVTGKIAPRAPRVGPEWLGFAGSERSLPALAEAAGDLRGLNQEQLNEVVGEFRPVWRADQERARPNGSFSASVGGEDPVFGQLIGYLGSLSYSYGQEARADERRAVAVADEGGAGTRGINQYAGSSGTASVLWGGLLNLSTRLGPGTKLDLTKTYTRSADNQATRLAGNYEEFGLDFDLTRLSFTERTVFSSRLEGQHLLGSRQSIDWTGSLSRVARHEPDRSDLVYVAGIDPATGRVEPRYWHGGPRSANRAFSELDETGLELGGSYTLQIGSVGRPASVKVGGNVRQVDREADSRAYDITNLSLSQEELTRRPELLFSRENALAGRFQLTALANSGRYTADHQLIAGFVQADVPLTSRLSLIGGARLERSDLVVDTRTMQGQVFRAELADTDVLPSLALNYRLTDNHVLRLSGSQTLSRPEYRELSEVGYFDILGGIPGFGNSALKRALIQNFDARWEWYSNPGEVVSVALFAKRFQDPIEKVLVATTGRAAFSFVNADQAHNYGVELELRQRLGRVADVLQPFMVFANATLIRSEIEPGNDQISALTNSSRPMVGQAPYVVNAGLVLAPEDTGLSATLLYNVVGKRIVEAGTQPLPDTYERPRQMLDLSLQYPLSGGASFKLDAKNLLDSPYELTQGAVTRLRYRTGRTLGLGVSWTL